MAGGFIDPDAVTPTSLVTERFSNAQTYANGAYNTALTFLTDLKNVVLDIPNIDVDIPFELESISSDIDIGVMPTKPSIDIDEIQTPSNLWTYNEEAYTSDLLNEVKATLLNDIQNEGRGLTAQIEQAIYDRESERDALALQDAKDRIAAEWAERGLDLPDGVLSASVNQVDIEYQNKQLDKSRDIAVKSEEISIANLRLSIEKSIVLEGVTIEHHNKQADRRIEAAKSVMMAALQVFDATIKKLMAKVQVYQAEVEAFKGEVDAKTSIVNAKATIVRAKVEQLVGYATVVAKRFDVLIKEYEVRAGFGVEAAKAGAAVAAQLASGALAGVSAQAHIESSISSANQTSSRSETSSSTSVATRYNYDMSS